MDEERERPETERVPFPGDRFWRGVESALTAVGLGEPRTIFKVRQARARWEARSTERANIDRGVAYTHKACPACGRLVPRGSGRCEYCGANVRWAPGPGLARTLGLSIPHGSVAMTIVTLNILVFGVSTVLSARAMGGNLLAAFFGPDARSLFNMGALFGPAVFDGQIWRLWTYMFLHGGIVHIGFNLYALLSLGPTTEDVYGPTKTVGLYWATGVGAGLVSLATRLGLSLAGGEGRFPVMVGASGALFGLIGLLIGHTFKRGGAYGANLRGFLVRWAIYGLAFGFLVPGIDNSAHVGGLATGFVLGLIVPDGEPRPGPSAFLWRLGAVGAIGLMVYGYIAAALGPHA